MKGGSKLAYLFLSPSLVLVSLFFLYPLSQLVYMSFCKWNIIGNYGIFVGLRNYVEILQDEIFVNSIVTTTVYTAMVVPLLAIGAIALAMLTGRELPGMAVFRAIYFSPWVIPWLSAGLTWLWMYNDVYGLINYVLRSLGLIREPILWFSDRWLAVTAVVIMVLWKAVGYNMVILMGGLSAIPKELYEAAEVDGAGRLYKFFYITLPLLKPTIALIVILAVAGSYLAFDHFYIMTHGAPAHTTETIVTWIYKTSFKHFKLGEGAAMSIILLLIVGTLSYIQVKVFKVLKV